MGHPVDIYREGGKWRGEAGKECFVKKGCGVRSCMSQSGTNDGRKAKTRMRDMSDGP